MDKIKELFSALLFIFIIINFAFFLFAAVNFTTDIGESDCSMKQKIDVIFPSVWAGCHLGNYLKSPLYEEKNK